MLIPPPDLNANAYLAVAEADAYFALRLYSQKWTSADENAKQAALVMASNFIDAAARYGGAKQDAAQRLQFPRVGITCDPSANGVIPQGIISATCEQALTFLQGDATQSGGSSGGGAIQSASVGAISVTYATATTATASTPLAKLAGQILAGLCYAEIITAGETTGASAGGFRNIDVDR
jgi:hypothetical protein